MFKSFQKKCVSLYREGQLLAQLVDSFVRLPEVLTASSDGRRTTRRRSLPDAALDAGYVATPKPKRDHPKIARLK